MKFPYFNNALMIAVLGGIVEIARRQERMEKRLMSKNEQLSADLAEIKANQGKASAAISDVAEDVTELKGKIVELTEALAAESVSDATLALADEIKGDSETLAAAAEAAANILPEPTPETPTDPTEDTEDTEDTEPTV